MITIIINLAIFLAGNLWMAWYHSQLITQHKPIKHGLWAGAYLVGVAIVSLLLGFLYAPVLILLRAMVFSPALNYFRKLPISYTSTTSTSIADRIERHVFKSFHQRMMWYGLALLVFTTLLIIIQ